MKDLHAVNRNNERFIVGKERLSEIMEMKQEIDRLKEKISELQLADKVKWGNSAIEVVFRNEAFAKKYKTSIERFLTTLLDGEPFVVDYRVSKAQEQEYLIGPNDPFCIDKLHGESSKNGPSSDIPVYNTSFEEVLHFEELKEDLEEKEADEKSQAVTCFNCLGNHHMKNCPENIDRLRISANRKDYQANTTSRYHEEEQLNSTMRPGCLSDSLRDALGLKPYQIPLHIYHMRVLGYPPGWMQESVFETSGLSLYDSEGRAIADHNTPTSKETKYDGTKFIDFPGFNTPVRNGFRDEWQELKMPPIQAHQQLSRALQSQSTINGVNVYKRKQSQNCFNGDIKKSRDAQGLNNLGWNPTQQSTRRRKSDDYRHNTPNRSGNKTPNNRKSCSLSVSPGTPIMEQGNCFKRLPDSDKFAEGITEHLPFENLPDSIGTFEKMRGVLSTLHEKQNSLNHEVS